MTEKEAIKRIKDHMRIHKIGEQPHIKLKEALDMAINSLKESDPRLRRPICYLSDIDYYTNKYAGLKRKFVVFRADTGELIENCFVLRPDKDPAAVDALRTYAKSTDNETLSSDIINWVGEERNDPLTVDELLHMNGEPVWWWNKSCIPICMICISDRFTNEPSFVNFDFKEEDCTGITKYRWLIKRGYKPYRSKPKEEQ